MLVVFKRNLNIPFRILFDFFRIAEAAATTTTQISQKEQNQLAFI